MLKSKIPSILAIFALTVGLAAGVFLIQSQQTFRLSASADYNPRDIRISNISSNSFTVSWYTDKNAVSFIDWNDNLDLKNRSFPKDSSVNRIHYITVDSLKPNTTYYFKVNSGGDFFDNSGVPWSVKTASENQSKTTLIKGNVMLDEKTPASGVIVYIQTSNFELKSTKTTENGSWVTKSDTISNPNEIIDIFVQGGALGSSSATVYFKDSQPVPTIMLGEVKNLTGSKVDEPFKLQDAQIILPEEKDSRF